MAASQFILYICLCIAAVTIKANPTPEGRKTTFSTATSIDDSKIEYNENILSDDDDDDKNELVFNSRKSSEFAVTLEEVKRIMELGAKGDWGNDPVDTRNPKDDVPGQEPSSFNTLKQGMGDIAQKSSVIGTDERVKVTPNGPPYTAMGEVGRICTGTFIAPRTVLTSAHCVYNTKKRQWNEDLDVQRQKDCDNPNQGTTHTWNLAITFKGWTYYKDPTYDIAVIMVDQSSPAWIAFASASVFSGNYYIAGYPEDKSGDESEDCLWLSRCPIPYVYPSFLYYQCDTYSGMSGSAVYKCRYNTQTVYGVHKGGYNRSYNRAVRITSFYESTIRHLIKKYNGN